MLTNDAELVARFQTKVVPTGGCAFWIGAVSDDGYGRFTLPGNRCVRPHVFAWELVNGPVRAGQVVLHACDEPLCVRLDHLSIGTQRQNLADMSARGRGAGPGRRGRGDTRGAHGRSLAIRDALRDGFDPEALAAAIAAGDPDLNQLALFTITPRSNP
jgi:hypothetical protein